MNYFFSFIFFCFTSISIAQVTTTNIEVESEQIEKIEQIEKKTYELLYKPSWFENDSVVKASVNMPKHEIPRLTDEEIIEFMQMIPTSFPLTFNNVVRQYIDQFSESRRLTLSQSLGLGVHYFPIFEETLNKYDLPQALKYLPIIESNMNPFAKSWAGAMGMWQFMPRTGKSLGLDQNDLYDERRDIYQSTDAAAQYLSTLYSIYGDWLLAIAAYNAGPGNVNKAIGVSGGKTTFWEIRPYLPKETRAYIPKFTACLFVMHYHDFFEILPQDPLTDFFDTDTIIIHDKLSIRYISELLGIDSTYLQFVNPALKTGIVPKTEKGYPLNIPFNFLGKCAALKDSISNDPYIDQIIANVALAKIPSSIVYKVKNGDTLGHIGERYGVGVSQIKKWNSLKSDALKIGQKLILYI